MGNRRTLTVRLETVTPLLLGGADGKTPELRPPSFRGAMRYWLRATLGGVIGDSHLEGLHKLENAVFGSTESGSPIRIRLQPLDTLKSSKVFILPHKHQGRRNALTGRLKLIMAQTRDVDEAIWNAACASLELALTFGGVGLRSRRGYGTLRTVEASDTRLSSFPTTLDGWKPHVNRVAQTAVQAATELASVSNVSISGLPTGPAAYPCATRSGQIRLCDLQERSAMDAVQSFMRRVQRNRALGEIRPRRQASPLWVRPIQTGSAQYGLLCVVLVSKFPGSDYDFVRSFLDKFRGHYLQVKGWNV